MKIQKVIRGRESLKKIPEMTERFHMQAPLIVGHQSLLSRFDRIPLLQTSPVFTGYHANPEMKDCEAGAAMFRDRKCDGLLAIGGGSAIDTAKGIKAVLAAGSLAGAKEGCFDREEIPLIAVPGTAGSGAEATRNAVLYENGTKSGLGGDLLLPDGVILDSALLDSLPEYHKKASALDALAQGIESYWSRSATEDSRVHAYLAILGVLDNLKAYLKGDSHAADEMLDASYQSGKAICITRTTAAHAMSYRLTMTMGLAHGHACFITLPVLWDRLAENPETREMIRILAGLMRLGDPLMGSRLLRGIMIDLRMQVPPMPSPTALDELAEAVNTERLGNHPVGMTREDVRDVYRASFVPLRENERQACMDIWRYYGGEDHD